MIRSQGSVKLSVIRNVSTKIATLNPNMEKSIRSDMITPHFGGKNFGGCLRNSLDDLFTGICQTQCILVRISLKCHAEFIYVRIDSIRHDHTALWWKIVSKEV